MTETQDDADETEPSGLRRVWQSLVDAGEWIADTFRGHSGAGDLKNREK